MTEEEPVPIQKIQGETVRIAQEEHKFHHIIPQPPRIGVFLAGAIILFLVFLMASIVINIKTKLSPPERHQITLSAEGKVKAVPDIAELRLTVISEGKKPSQAEKENSDKMNRIIDFLKSLGLEEKDLQTSHYSLEPKYYYPFDYPRIPCPLPEEVYTPNFICPPKTPVIIGFKAIQTLTVKVRQFKILGELIDGVVERGVNQIGEVSFSIEDPENLKAQARVQALNKAREKAKSLAETAGVKLGKVITFSEGEVYFPLPRYYERAAAFETIKEEGPKFEPGQEEVKVILNVTFEIK